ncbi:trypsin-like peptidase domain-containing protein [Actinoplanes sp. KI2]|uniref:S1C family serine protease n=1 Tax=Actinoplanes sp. KI2 TaxID=2983315 RepID=UPI0021D603BB|nr:trypsin-like peptidase domain-containing protein [Actinoplanes sp. KI2]MCU7724511.1 trypsin-like peptidase domain-containing protein [Actinoplanes sp. KI2]
MNENETDPRPADASTESSSPESGQSAQPTVAVPTHAGAPGTPQPPAPAEVPGGGSVAPQPPQPASPWHQQPQQPQSPWQQPGQQPQQPAHAEYSPYAQQPAYAGAWTEGGTQQQPAVEGQAWQQPGEGHPVWAAPVGDQRPPSNGRGRKIFVAGAAAVLIALVAGGVGAATALAFDKGDGSSPKVQVGNSSISRVVDRSSLAQIASMVEGSVVSITTESGEGSGVITSADGYIVTNNHVVATAQGDKVTVIFADGKKATATIVGTDPRTDLAVVKASGVSDLKPAHFGSSANMQVGDTVLAIGSPLGLEGSVTAGIISAKDRTIQSSSEGEGQQSPFGSNQQQQGSSTTMSGLLQTDAPINPGNSGGALVNTNGEVIGINSAIATQGQGSGNIGLGFAIPSDKASQVANDLMAGKKVSHPALGVSVTDAENGGALVSSVTPNSPAAKAGLQQGDVITAVDGKAIDDSNDLVAAVQGGTVGQKMVIEFTRDGAKQQATATLAEAE